MNTNGFTIPQLQFLQQTLRNTIRDTHNDIVDIRNLKKIADVAGNIEQEYFYHNAVKRARKDLKQWVAMQMSCKAALRKAYGH